jgi:hypothetical protein
VQAHNPDRFNRISETPPQLTHQPQQQTPKTSGSLGDIHLTTFTYHFEPQPQPYMGEREFALAIATEYITVWAKYTQASIARYLRTIEANVANAKKIQDDWLPERRKYLEEIFRISFRR